MKYSYGLANHEHIFGHKGQDTVYFLKTKKHYDALIEKRDRPRRQPKPTLKMKDNEVNEESKQKSSSGDIKSKLTQTIRQRDNTIREKNMEIQKLRDQIETSKAEKIKPDKLKEKMDQLQEEMREKKEQGKDTTRDQLLEEPTETYL